MPKLMSKNQRQFYLAKFRGSVFVLKIGGEVVQNRQILTNLLKDIKELADLGIHVVLVHGGGSQADQLAKKLGHTPVKINGRRVTGETDLEIVKMLYGGSLNLEILSIMKKLKAHGIRVSGLDGNLLDVKIRRKKGVDFGYVGDIKKVNPQIIFDLLEKNYLPIISPLGVTANGTIVNINADTIAISLAIALKAEKLILFTTADGVYGRNGLIKTLDTRMARKLIKENIIKDGMRVKIENCLKAVIRGVRRIHVLNGLSRHSLLLEVLTRSGTGTMIVSAHEKEIYLEEDGK